MSELTVGTISGLAANNYVVDVASGSNIALPSSSLPTGTVLQVVHSVSSTVTTTTSTEAVNTDLYASITPISSSNKILIIASGVATHSGSTTYGSRFAIYRGGASGIRTDGFVSVYTQDNVSRVDVPVSIQYLDSPATDSSVTYNLCIWSGVSAVTSEFGKIGYGNMTLMEIAQ